MTLDFNIQFTIDRSASFITILKALSKISRQQKIVFKFIQSRVLITNPSRVTSSNELLVWIDTNTDVLGFINYLNNHGNVLSIEVSTHALLKLFKNNFISANFLIISTANNDNGDKVLKVYTTHIINYSQYCTSEHVISIDCNQESIEQIREPNIARPNINLMVNRVEKLQKFVQGISMLEGLTVVTVTSTAKGTIEITAHTESCPVVSFTMDLKVIHQNEAVTTTTITTNTNVNHDQDNNNKEEREREKEREKKKTFKVLLPLKTFGRLLDLANECTANGAHVLLSIAEEKYILFSISMALLESNYSLVLNLLIPARIE